MPDWYRHCPPPRVAESFDTRINKSRSTVDIILYIQYFYYVGYSGDR